MRGFESLLLRGMTVEMQAESRILAKMLNQLGLGSFWTISQMRAETKHRPPCFYDLGVQGSLFAWGLSFWEKGSCFVTG